MTITLTWHLILLVIVEGFFFYKLVTVDLSGDYNFAAGIELALYFFLIIIVALLYGGIFWW